MITLAGNRTALPIALVLGLIAACGTPDQKAAPAPAPVQAVHVPTSAAVSIAQMSFHPDTLQVQRGDTVIFTNNDVVDHDVTELPDSLWTSHLMHPGDSWKWVADSTAYYFCSIHVVMRGRVIVQ